MRKIYKRTLKNHLTFFNPAKNVLNRLNDPWAKNEA